MSHTTSAPTPVNPRLTPAGKQWIAAVVALVVVAALFHVPRLNKPFGLVDVNAGSYFGLFVKSWQDFGFFELRGIPLAPQRLLAPNSGGIPYLNHPPGVPWLCAALGSDESCFRLPTAIAAAAAAVALLLLLRSQGQTVAGAGVAALTLLGTPSVTIYSQASYETPVLACGLWLLLATRQLQHGRHRGWRSAQLASAFVGPWMDWSFVFFCLGLVALTATKDLRRWLLRLLVPGLVAAMAVASIFTWRAWAMRCPLLDPGAFPDASVGEIIRTTILSRPEFLDGITRSVTTLTVAVGLPVLLGGLAGVAWFARRSPKLLVALTLAGTAQPLVFAHHATDHTHFYCYTAGLLAAASSGLTSLPRPWPALAGWLAAIAVAAGTWTASLISVRHSDTDFQRVFGQTLAQATEVSGRRLPIAVATNFGALFPYYVNSPDVLVGTGARVDQILAPARRDARLPYGYRFVWLRDIHGGAAGIVNQSAEVEALGRFPRTRLPHLQRHETEPRLGFDLDIREAWLVEVPPEFCLVLLHAEADTARAQQVAGALLDEPALVFAKVLTLPIASPAAEAQALLTQATHLAWLDSAAANTELDAAKALQAHLPTLLEQRPLVAVRNHAALTPSVAAWHSHANFGEVATSDQTDAAGVARAIARAHEDIVVRHRKRVDRRRRPG